MDKFFKKISSLCKEYFIGYRKSFWFITGTALAAISAVIMCVCMFFMYFGNNRAILWFLISAVVFTFGILTAQTVKRRYQEAASLNLEPLPMFWHIRYVILLLREFIANRGLWRLIFIALTCVSLIVTLSFAAISGHFYLERDDIERNIEYLQNQEKYEEYEALWYESRYITGDSEAAENYWTIAQSYHEKNAGGRAQIKVYTDKMNENLIRTGISGIVTLFFGTVLTAYILKKRHQEKLDNAELKPF